MKKISFAAYVWGEKSLHIFSSLVSTNIMRTAHLIATRHEVEMTFEIFTDASTAIIIDKNYSAIRDFWSVRVPLQKEKYSSNYRKLGELQYHSFRSAHINKVDYLVPVYADLVFFGDGLLNAYEEALSGAPLVLGIAPQVRVSDLDEASMLFGPDVGFDAFEKNILNNIDAVRGPGRYNTPDIKCSPAVLFYHAGDEQPYIRAFHQHPFCIAIGSDPIFTRRFYGTLDEHFVPALVGDCSRIRFLSSSNQMLACSLEVGPVLPNNVPITRNTERAIYLFSESNAFDINYNMFKFKPFHYGCRNNTIAAMEKDRLLFDYIETRRKRGLSDLRETDPEAWHRRRLRYKTQRKIHAYCAQGVGYTSLAGILYKSRSLIAPLIPISVKRRISDFIVYCWKNGIIPRGLAQALSLHQVMDSDLKLQQDDFKASWELDTGRLYNEANS